MRPVADKLQELMPGTPVHFVGECIGETALRAVNALKPGEVAMLENLRYHAGEEKNDPAFAKALAELGDVYVDDAFSSAHRAHASIDAITHLLPSYAGFLMMAEIRALERALEHPERPALAIVGGAKVSTKIDVLVNLAAKLDVLVVGGAMANTFLLAQGVDIGRLARRARRRRHGQGDPGPRRTIALRDRSPHRRGRGQGAEGGRRMACLRRRRHSRRRHDPRSRAANRRRPQSAFGRGQDAAVERPARRFRDRPLRRGDVCARPRGGPPHQGG